MTTALVLIAAVVMLGVVYVLLPVAASSYRKARGARTVVCPETSQLTTIELDAKRAAWTSTLGEPKLTVAKCDRWPEHRECDQECLKPAQSTIAA